MDPLKLELFDKLKGSYTSLFNQIDENQSGFLDFNNLLSFFKQIGVYPYEEEIVSGLRFMDKNDDGRINLEELKQGSIPRLSDTKLTKTQGSKSKEKFILDSNQKCCRIKTPEKVFFQIKRINIHLNQKKEYLIQKKRQKPMKVH